MCRNLVPCWVLVVKCLIQRTDWWPLRHKSIWSKMLAFFSRVNLLTTYITAQNFVAFCTGAHSQALHTSTSMHRVTRSCKSITGSQEPCHRLTINHCFSLPQCYHGPVLGFSKEQVTHWTVPGLPVLIWMSLHLSPQHSPSHILPDNPIPLLLWRYFHYFNVLSSWVELWKHTGPLLSMVEEGSELGHPGLALSGLIQDKITWFKYAKYITTMLRTSLT